MALRKLYVQLKFFLYSNRKTTNKIIVFFMLSTLFILFINFFLFNRVILGKASHAQTRKEYKSAIFYYNLSYAYYTLNHFSDENKEIYFDIPFQKSICYLKLNEQKKSLQSIFREMKTIQRQYGVFSEENAYFVRKYLIPYYIDNNYYKLALQEFNNLLTIYKNIPYNNNEMADVIRIRGDLYYQQKKYATAMTFYEKAYTIISVQQNIDYSVFAKIVENITEYEIEINQPDLAINVYQSSINTLRNSGKKQDKLRAEMLISLGDLYRKDDKAPKEALKCYEEAVSIIRTLPHSTSLRQDLITYLTILKDLYAKNGQYPQSEDIRLEITKRSRFGFLF